MSNSVNLEILNEIKELQSDSDPDVLVTLLRMFLAGIPQKMTRLEAAIQGAKPEEVQSETHSLKSSSANVGATLMAAYCTELEQLAKEGGLVKAGDLFTKLKVEVAIVTLELESLPEMKAFKKKSA